jgi:hypothetical protein
MWNSNNEKVEEARLRKTQTKKEGIFIPYRQGAGKCSILIGACSCSQRKLDRDLL